MLYYSARGIEPFSNCRPDFTVHVLYPKDMMSYDATMSPLFNLLHKNEEAQDAVRATVPSSSDRFSLTSEQGDLGAGKLK